MRVALTVLALWSAGTATWAQEDGLSLSASYRLQQDDNLFRLADGVDPVSVLGRPDTGETVHVRSLGLRYARNFSLQRIEASVGVVDYDYDTFSRLDLLANNHDIRWAWSITPVVTGSLRTLRDESVNSFADASVLNSDNRRTRRFDSADLRWQIDGAWFALTELQRSRNVNEQPLVGEESSQTDTAAIGVGRQTPKGSSATLRWQTGSGRTFDPAGAPSPLRDDNFSQNAWVLDLNWVASGRSTLLASLSGIDRRHDRVPLRDYQVLNGRLQASWSPSARTLLRGTWSRENASYQTDQASITRNDQWSLLANWSITHRMSLSAQLSEARRRFLRPLPGQSPDPRRDHTRDQSLTLRWSFTDDASMDLRWLSSRRFSTDPAARFRSHGLQWGLSASF